MRNATRVFGILSPLLFALTFVNSLAQPSPPYLHALSDLRMARAHLESRPDHLPLTADERAAVSEINRALDEVKVAAAADRKDLEARPPVDLPRDWAGRLHRTLELLNSAYQDVDRVEENPSARGPRSRALGHISRARSLVHDALEFQSRR